VPHPFFAHFAKKGGRRHCRKARFVGRARLQSCHKDQKNRFRPRREPNTRAPNLTSQRTQNILPDTNNPRPTRRSLATDAVSKPAHQPAPDRLSATPTQPDSPHSAHRGRTVPHPSSRHPTIRVISCSWEEHDFSRAIKTKKDPGTANPRDADQNHQAPAPKGRQTTAQDVSPGSGQKKIQASQTRPTGQKADRPLTSLPIPPPPCESSPNSCHPERSRGTLRPPRSGVPHPFFAHFAKKGGRRHCRKARFVEGHDFSRAIKIRKRFRHRKPARPDKKLKKRSPAHLSSNRSAAL
jgi:hypothetical protein